jgi:hypothetical protein
MSRLRKLIEFYVREHNSRLPHSAFRAQTPDEMYFRDGKGGPRPAQPSPTRRSADAAWR